jgi:hypothetical protein
MAESRGKATLKLNKHHIFIKKYLFFTIYLIYSNIKIKLNSISRTTRKINEKMSSSLYGDKAPINSHVLFLLFHLYIFHQNSI